MKKNDLSALFKLSYGLYILSAKNDEKDNACVVNSFLQITANEPILCVLSINKHNYTTELISSSKKFNLSVLTTDAPFELIKHFGFQPGRELNKFQDFGDISRSENGLIYLTKYANAFFSFDVLESFDFGTHLVFKAALSESKVLDNNESMTYAYYHSKVKPQPQTAKKTGWRCTVCNYVYEGDPLPEGFICPVCGVGAEYFVKQ